MFGIILAVQKCISEAKEEKATIKRTDSYSNNENVSYLIDYNVASSTASGGHCLGSIYIRGLKGNGDGSDAYKFVLEKSVDFAALDSDIFLKVLEEVNRMQPPASPEQ